MRINKMKACPKCSVLLTKENAYKRKGGYWCGYCKECDLLRLYEFNHKGDSEIKILNEIYKLNERIDILIDILMKSRKTKKRRLE